MLEELLQKYDDAVMESNTLTESSEWVAYTDALTEARKAYDSAVEQLQKLPVYARHIETAKAVGDAETALRDGVVAWWGESDKSQKSTLAGRLSVCIGTKYAVENNVAFVQALNSITHAPNLIEKLVKKIEINQGSIAETATLLDIPLSVTETVSAVVKGVK